MSANEPLQGPQEGRDELRRDRNSKIASQVLESAIKGVDVSVLKQAITWARKSNLPCEQIERACARQMTLESNQVCAKVEAEEDEPINLPSDVVSEHVSFSNASGGAADRAKKRRVGPRKETSENRERREVKEALGLATAGTDLETLSSTLAWAESVGVDEATLEFARRRLAKLEVSTQLRSAMSSCSMADLTLAISKADAAELDAQLIESARVELKALELQTEREKEQKEQRVAAQTLLDDLLQASDVDVASIEDALERAVYAGVSGDILIRARRSVLLQKEDIRKGEVKEARDKLKILCDSFEDQNGKIEAIQQAIDHALRIGDAELTGEALTAQALVDAVKQAEELQIKYEACRALTLAIEWGGIEALETSLDRAYKAGVEGELIANARRQMSMLQDAELLTHATKKLEDAIAGTSAEHLRSIVISSMQVGVSMVVLWSAQKRMLELQKTAQCELLREAATLAIHDAAKKRNEDKLRLALSRGEELGVDEEVIRVAKMRLAQML